MPKLTTIKPLVTKLAPVLRSREHAQRLRLRERDENIEWRGWYKLKRWRDMREQVLVRDFYVCQRTGVRLNGKYPAPDSPVADHIKPHRGNPELFWNIDNIQAVSKEWHDSVKQALENADKIAAFHPKWLKPSIIPLTIVCGPPASGKSTYVRNHAAPNDLVIDLDVIASEMSGEPLHGWNPDEWLNAALYRRNDLLGRLSRASRYNAAWFIVSEPKAHRRDWWQQTLKPQRIIVIEADERQCLANAAKDGDRDMNRADASITKWWVEYDRRIGDERV